MVNLDKIVSKKSNDENWSFRMLIIGPSGSGKTNTLLHLIQNLNKTKPVDKIYLYAKDLSELKYECLINNRKNAGVKHFNDPTVFIEYSNDKNDAFINIDDYNKQKKQKVLIIFDDMITYIMSDKKSKAIIKNFLFDTENSIFLSFS